MVSTKSLSPFQVYNKKLKFSKNYSCNYQEGNKLLLLKNVKYICKIHHASWNTTTPYHCTDKTEIC